MLGLFLFSLLASLIIIQVSYFLIKKSYKKLNKLKKDSEKLSKLTKDLQAAHNQLEYKNKELLIILDNIKTSVFFINKFGRILLYNSASKDLIQQFLSLERFKNKKVSFFGKQIKETFFKLIRELKDSEKTNLTQEISFTFKSESKTLMVHLTAIQDAQKRLLVVIEDLTTIVKINKIKTWQEAAKQMAHEIKNPLTPIQLATQRLQRKLQKNKIEDQSMIECTKTILNHVKIIKDLASHFSEFASMPKNNIEPIDINKILKEGSCLYQISYPDIKIEYKLEKYLPLMKLDKKKMRRVIINLLDNSTRVLKLEKSKDNNFIPSIEIKTTLKKGWNQIEILISDNGPGINKEVQNTIFLPYVSGSKKNMGLGLAITHDIIKKLNGSIKLVPSTKGATFQILLPI